ncbi:probable WRKY transcription factor 53 [Phtheirospermum japonicum]|uniref:Probable WRKY transcription factor 53 n=1 Tax=Phtheirospermum japonicum TaxID=374723 RepID=A0A830B9E8_9LAMI|nr:probable WRKY transcription factor 53 [Phtheirospermum japonicum]
MESGLSSSWEYKTLISELTQGMEKAKQLHFHMCSTSPSEAQDLLLQRILSSYEKALLILKRKGSSAVGQAQAQVVALTSGGPEPSISVDGSPGSEDLNKNLIRDHQECSPSKKRKLQPIWTEQVRVNSENGLDGPSDGGYSWRKYGRKTFWGLNIPGAITVAHTGLVQNCWATKQVQRSDEDPNVFEITYKGTHTCTQSTNAVPPPLSPDQKQEFQQSPQTHQQPQQNQYQTLLSFKANLRVSTDSLDGNNTNNEMPAQFTFPSTYPENHDFHVGSSSSYCPSFVSPATSDTNNYFSPVNNYQSFGANRK